jgi:uncharacterized alpha/beta hydrolase family protein
MKYPMQPIVNGSFEANPIIDWLATEVSDMNKICMYCHENNIDDKYQEQLAQLVGYSIGGYASLSYVSDESYERATKQQCDVVELTEYMYGSGKALLVSQILNADEQTIERVLKAMEKNDD